MAELAYGGLRDVTSRLASGLRAVSSLLQEKRRYRRIALPLVVKMLLDDGTEDEAIVRDISAGGAALLTELRPRPGSKIIVYIQDIGRVEGIVVREQPHGFSIDFTSSMAKRDRIADKLTWLSNRARLGLYEEEQGVAGIKGQEAEIFLPDGEQQACRVVALSLNGASIQICPRPSIGTEVVLGRMRGNVTHHLPDGIGIEFTGPAQSTASNI